MAGPSFDDGNNTLDGWSVGHGFQPFSGVPTGNSSALSANTTPTDSASAKQSVARDYTGVTLDSKGTSLMDIAPPKAPQPPAPVPQPKGNPLAAIAPPGGTFGPLSIPQNLQGPGGAGRSALVVGADGRVISGPLPSAGPLDQGMAVDQGKMPKPGVQITPQQGGSAVVYGGRLTNVNAPVGANNPVVSGPQTYNPLAEAGDLVRGANPGSATQILKSIGYTDQQVTDFIRNNGVTSEVKTLATGGNPDAARQILASQGVGAKTIQAVVTALQTGKPSTSTTAGATAGTQTGVAPAEPLGGPDVNERIRSGDINGAVAWLESRGVSHDAAVTAVRSSVSAMHPYSHSPENTGTPTVAGVSQTASPTVVSPSLASAEQVQGGVPTTVTVGSTKATGYNVDGHIYAPVRAIAEAGGKKVGWDAATRVVTVNGVEVPYVLIDGKAYAPVRSFMGAEDSNYRFDPNTATLTVGAPAGGSTGTTGTTDTTGTPPIDPNTVVKIGAELAAGGDPDKIAAKYGFTGTIAGRNYQNGKFTGVVSGASPPPPAVVPPDTGGGKSADGAKTATATATSSTVPPAPPSFTPSFTPPPVPPGLTNQQTQDLASLSAQLATDPQMQYLLRQLDGIGAKTQAALTPILRKIAEQRTAATTREQAQEQAETQRLAQTRLYTSAYGQSRLAQLGDNLNTRMAGFDTAEQNALNDQRAKDEIQRQQIQSQIQKLTEQQGARAQQAYLQLTEKQHTEQFSEWLKTQQLNDAERKQALNAWIATRSLTDKESQFASDLALRDIISQRQTAVSQGNLLARWSEIMGVQIGPDGKPVTDSSGQPIPTLGGEKQTFAEQQALRDAFIRINTNHNPETAKSLMDALVATNPAERDAAFADAQKAYVAEGMRKDDASATLEFYKKYPVQMASAAETFLKALRAGDTTAAQQASDLFDQFLQQPLFSQAALELKKSADQIAAQDARSQATLNETMRRDDALMQHWKNQDANSSGKATEYDIARNRDAIADWDRRYAQAYREYQARPDVIAYKNYQQQLLQWQQSSVLAPDLPRPAAPDSVPPTFEATDAYKSLGSRPALLQPANPYGGGANNSGPTAGPYDNINGTSVPQEMRSYFVSLDSVNDPQEAQKRLMAAFPTPTQEQGAAIHAYFDKRGWTH